jgi:IclR family transcriptional regulator, KDG regulon repressor
MPERYQNTSAERVFQLLECFSDDDAGLSLTELVRRSKLSKATAFRFLAVLVRLGYLERGNDDAYSLGYRLFELGSRVDQSAAIQRRVRPHLAELASTLNETAHLGVLRSTSVVYVATVDGGRPMLPGHREQGIDAHASGIGKVLLAFLPEERVRQLYAGRHLEARTARTITNLEMLLRVLRQIRVQRYGFDMGELDNGLRCVAAPVFDAAGNAPCAISISGPASRISDLALPKIIAAVSIAAASASATFIGIEQRATETSAPISVTGDSPSDEMETLFDR